MIVAQPAQVRMTAAGIGGHEWVPSRLGALANHAGRDWSRSSLVDVSPLSTIGALCVAASLDPATSRKLFYQMLTWGFAMIVVGALLCQLFAGMMSRWQN